jgi:CHASE1-domain containing sensor protein
MDIVPRRNGTLSRVAQPRPILLTMALALASMLAMTIAPPAQAQPQAQTAAQTEAQIACPANRICLYEHINFGGRVAIYATGSSDMSRFGPSFNNLTSSIVNNTGARWCAYDQANYQGLLLTIAPRQRIPWVGAANDRISSLRKC